LNTLNQTETPLKDTLLLCLGLTLFVIILYLPFLGSLPLLHEEPRRVLIAQTMLETGNFFVPMLLDQIYTAKPPVFNWIIAVFSLPGGEITEFSARLPSVVFLLIMAIVMVVGLRRYLSMPGQFFLGFAILLTPELMAKANIAEIEIVFTFLVTLSIWSWYWLYDRDCSGIKLWLLPLVIVAISFLTKREPALVFFYLSIVPFLIFDKKFKALFSLGHIVSVAVMLLIVGSWLALMTDRVGVDALLGSLQAEVVSRGLTSSIADYFKHIATYPLQIFAALLPLGLLLIPLYKRDTRTLLKQRYGNLYVFCILAVLINLPLYLFRGDAAVRYYLPMFPTIVVLITLVFETYYHNHGAEHFSKIIRTVVKFCSVLLLLLALVLLASAFIPWWTSPPVLLVPWFVVLVVAIPVVVVALKMLRPAFHGSPKTVFPVLIGVLVIIKLLYFSAILPYKIERINKNRNAALVMKEIEKLIPDNEKIQVLGHTHYALWFYAKPGMLRFPSEYSEQAYKGYIMLYDTSAELKNMSKNNWQELARIPYRDISLILGKQD